MKTYHGRLVGSYVLVLSERVTKFVTEWSSPCESGRMLETDSCDHRLWVTNANRLMYPRSPGSLLIYVLLEILFSQESCLKQCSVGQHPLKKLNRGP